MSGDDNRDSTAGGLLMRIASSGFRLLRGELELRRAEAGLALGFVIRGVVMIVLALILALLGIGQMVDAGHAGLVAAGLGPVAASLVTGGVLCLLAVGLGLWGQSRIRRAPFLAREARYLRRDLLRDRAAEQKEDENDRPV